MEPAPDAQAELLALRRRCAELERENGALRRSGEQAARERDDYRRRYDDLPLSCLTLDASGCVVEGNARFAALLGLAPTPLPGVHLESVIAVPQHVQRLREHLVTVFRSPGLHSCELWLRRPDGGVARVRLESAAVHGTERNAMRLCRTVIAEVTAPAQAAPSGSAAGEEKLARPASTPPPPRSISSTPPPAPSSASLVPAGSVPTSRAARATVLVVEDESLVRKAVQHYLTTAGYRVLTAADGGAALERSERHEGTIDLILTDLSFPDGATGPEIAKQINERRPGAAVLYMTACPPDLLARRGFELSDAQPLEKPFSKETLLARVGATLAKVRLDV